MTKKVVTELNNPKFMEMFVEGAKLAKQYEIDEWNKHMHARYGIKRTALFLHVLHDFKEKKRPYQKLRRAILWNNETVETTLNP